MKCTTTGCERELRKPLYIGELPFCRDCWEVMLEAASEEEDIL